MIILTHDVFFVNPIDLLLRLFRTYNNVMLKIIGLIVLALVFLAAAIFIFYKQPRSMELSTRMTDIMNQYKPSTPTPTEIVDFTAEFSIVTNGTTRIFTDLRYHNLNKDVFIASSSPSTVNVKRAGVTWGDFFETLPMKLTKECLTTGTGQVFCTNQTSKLSFYINNIENPDALVYVIKPGDVLFVEYKSVAPAQGIAAPTESAATNSAQ